MYVLHAHWSAGTYVWVEDSTAPPRRSSAKGSRQTPTEHPFAAGADVVAALVDLANPPTTTITLRLPTKGGSPLPSPELVRERPAAKRKPALAEWRVPAVALPPEVDLAYLSDAADVVTGASVRWYAAVQALAGDLADRGRVVPGLRGESAVWLPVLTGPDAAGLRSLAEAMPPVCRAEPGASGHDALIGALEWFVDVVVRRRLRGVHLAPPLRRRTATLAERWLAALTSSTPQVDVSPQDDLVALAKTLDHWRAELHTGAGPVRACFRLVEPSDADPDIWQVDFLLQATDDPSLLISARSVWANRARTLSTSYGVIANAEEALLSDLGRASRLFPDIETELRARYPEAVSLDIDGAQRFLRTAAPVLIEAGFGVLLPSWWSDRRRRLGLKLTARSSSRQDPAASRGSGLDMKSLAEFQFELALGEDTLSAAELAELARTKAPLVRLRGQWVEVDRASLARALDFLAARGSGEATAADVLALAVDPEMAADGLPVTEVRADGWLGALLSGDLPAVEEVQPPDGFAGTLRPYQLRGLSWLRFLSRLGLGACLADDMGLGKTPTTLALLASETGTARARRGDTSESQQSPALVVCPMSVVGNWQREAARFAPKLRVYVHHGSQRLSGDEFRVAVTNADLVLTTYSLAARDADQLASVAWRRVVLDEAQNIKNSQARQTQAVRTMPAAHRVALTGTPVENRLAELWSIMEFLNPGLLGSAARFRERFAVPIERYRDADAASRLQRATRPFILRRLKTDRSIIDDLPDKLEMTVLCNLTPEQASLYQAIVDDMLGKIEHSEGMERRGLVLATMMKLKQVCNHPAHLLRDGSRLPGRSGKLARLEELAEEVVADGDKALVFTQFAEFGALLTPYLTGHLAGVPILYLHGGTTKRERDEMVARFQSLDGPAVFVLSLKAGGTGLNLTAANHVIHYDRWWNPAVESQATDRAFRIGQRKDVQIRKFVCVGTLEERIDALIEEKKALAELVVGVGESWLTELSTDELRELVILDAETAVAE